MMDSGTHNDVDEQCGNSSTKGRQTLQGTNRAIPTNQDSTHVIVVCLSYVFWRLCCFLHLHILVFLTANGSYESHLCY